jgi:peptidoglycan/LPS O-acetylase OafA/YrhL
MSRNLLGNEVLIKTESIRLDIQVLRGLAVLAVLLFHGKESLFPQGYLGVDVFFVVSGFVVTPLIQRIFLHTQPEKISFWGKMIEFYRRRFFRLAPALAVTLVISAFVIFLFAPTSDHMNFTKQGIATILIFGNLGALVYSGDYFNPNPNPLIHTWSLSVEEQIYFFLPLILGLITWRFKSKSKVASISLWIIGTLSLISFLKPEIMLSAYSALGIRQAEQFSFYSPIDRIWQFAIGGIGYFLLSSPNHSKKSAGKINIILASSLLLILFGPMNLGLKSGSIVVSMITLAVIYFESLISLPKIVQSKLAWLGDRSYSIYLIHMPLLYIAKLSPVIAIPFLENRIIQSSLAVVLSIVLGSYCYTKVENRFRIQGNGRKLSGARTLGSILLFIFLPLCIFSSFSHAISKDYWGFNKHIAKPHSPIDYATGCLDEGELVNLCINRIHKSDKTVLLIGDSHAGHLSLAVREAAKNANWNSIYARTGDIENIESRGEDSLSNPDFDEFLRWVSKTKPQLIIISEYIDRDTSQMQFKRGLLRLKKIVPQLLIVENNPVWPDEKFNFSSPLITPYVPVKNFAITDMDISNKPYSDRIAKWSKENGISSISLDSLFCNEVECRRYSTAGWLYIDTHHFSVEGAKLAIPQIEAFLQQLNSVTSLPPVNSRG